MSVSQFSNSFVLPSCENIWSTSGRDLQILGPEKNIKKRKKTSMCKEDFEPGSRYSPLGLHPAAWLLKEIPVSKHTSELSFTKLFHILTVLFWGVNRIFTAELRSFFRGIRGKIPNC